MNSTFKVVFNKARGALMVVNEVTSSVQAKGTKTVVATAVAAMIAGVASAATDTAYTEVTGVTIKGEKSALTVYSDKQVATAEGVTITAVNAGTTIPAGTLFTSNDALKDGSVKVNLDEAGKFIGVNYI